MKLLLILMLGFLANCTSRQKQVAPMYFFPNKKSDLERCGFKTNKDKDGYPGFIKTAGDTTIRFFYPTDSYYVKELVYARKIDTPKLFNYFKTLDPSFTDSSFNLKITDEHGEQRTYRIISKLKWGITLSYTQDIRKKISIDNSSTPAEIIVDSSRLRR